MKVLDYFGLAVGVVVLLFGIVTYLRDRVALSRTFAARDPLAVDGWNTFHCEPGYEDLYIDLRNEAFGRFVRISLVGAVAISSAYGLQFRHDAFDFLMDLK